MNYFKVTQLIYSWLVKQKENMETACLSVCSECISILR